MTIEPDAFVDREPGRLALQEARVLMNMEKAEAEHGRRPRDPLAYDGAGGPVPYGVTLWLKIWDTCTA